MANEPTIFQPGFTVCTADIDSMGSVLPKRLSPGIGLSDLAKEFLLFHSSMFVSHGGLPTDLGDQLAGQGMDVQVWQLDRPFLRGLPAPFDRRLTTVPLESAEKAVQFLAQAAGILYEKAFFWRCVHQVLSIPDPVVMNRLVPVHFFGVDSTAGLFHYRPPVTDGEALLELARNDPSEETLRLAQSVFAEKPTGVTDALERAEYPDPEFPERDTTEADEADRDVEAN